MLYTQHEKCLAHHRNYDLCTPCQVPTCKYRRSDFATIFNVPETRSDRFLEGLRETEASEREDIANGFTDMRAELADGRLAADIDEFFDQVDFLVATHNQQHPAYTITDREELAKRFWEYAAVEGIHWGDLDAAYRFTQLMPPKILCLPCYEPPTDFWQNLPLGTAFQVHLPLPSLDVINAAAAAAAAVVAPTATTALPHQTPTTPAQHACPQLTDPWRANISTDSLTFRARRRLKHRTTSTSQHRQSSTTRLHSLLHPLLRLHSPSKP